MVEKNNGFSYNDRMKQEHLAAKSERELQISSLKTGGLITNYHCSSLCRHCGFNCSPRWEKEYIREESAARLFEAVCALGCRSLHIGGGEPFLNIEGLKKVLRQARSGGIHIEFVETNSSWYRDHNSACRTLEELQSCSLSQLLVSISPFHNEYIPFYKVKGVIAACHAVGMSIIPWVKDFYPDLDSLPDDTPHSLDFYLEAFGSNYIKQAFKVYWIYPAGRALTNFLDLYRKRRTQDFLENSSSCTELTDTSHFHFDLYENYVPGLCNGIQIHYSDIGKSLAKTKYPFLHALYNHGIRGLYEKAAGTYGFVPQENYVSKCHLCLAIRRFLVIEKKLEIREFGPYGFYREIDDYP
jgi:hypothetical protein